jgi:hypothetical protein
LELVFGFLEFFVLYHGFFGLKQSESRGGLENSVKKIMPSGNFSMLYLTSSQIEFLEFLELRVFFVGSHAHVYL